MKNIEVRRMSGNRKACYVDGKKAFEMHKSQHKTFNARVERLRKQDRVDTWLMEQRRARLALITVEEAPTPLQNVIAASVARVDGLEEAERRLNQSLVRWFADGMPVSIPISSAPLFGGFAHE